MNETEIWNSVRGIDSDGPEIRKSLEDLIEGRLPPEFKDELLCDFSRDYQGSTAGYAAIPIFLREGYPPQLAYDLTVTAALVLTYGAMRDDPPVPEFLTDRTGKEARELAITRLRKAISDVKMSMFELVNVVALIAALDGRKELHDLLEVAARDHTELRRADFD